MPVSTYEKFIDMLLRFLATQPDGVTGWSPALARRKTAVLFPISAIFNLNFQLVMERLGKQQPSSTRSATASKQLISFKATRQN